MMVFKLLVRKTSGLTLTHELDAERQGFEPWNPIKG